MIKDNCKHIPLHLLNQMLDNNGQTSSGQEYDMTALQERANELEERNADDLFTKHMTGLFAQADVMVQASKAVITKAIETMKVNAARFKVYHDFNLLGFMHKESTFFDLSFEFTGSFKFGINYLHNRIKDDFIERHYCFENFNELLLIGDFGFYWGGK